MGCNTNNKTIQPVQPPVEAVPLGNSNLYYKLKCFFKRSVVVNGLHVLYWLQQPWYKSVLKESQSGQMAVVQNVVQNEALFLCIYCKKAIKT